MIDEQISSGHIVLYDLEWTSWPGFMEARWLHPGRHREIIQIGAVRVDAGQNFEEIDAFECFVKPTFNPQLSSYITELTGITQHEIDTHGVPFADALQKFTSFLSMRTDDLVSFGFDGQVIQENCRINSLETPAFFAKEKNLRLMLLDLNLIDDRCCSSDLPAQVGIESVETPHNALGDTRATLAALRHLRSQGKI